MTDFDQLYRKFIDQQCTREEAEQLLDHFLTEKGDVEMARLIAETLESESASLNEADELAIDRNERKLMAKITPNHSWKPAYTIIAIAASIVLALATYMALKNTNAKDLIPNHATLVDAEPGGNRAVLTLADGKTINLDSAANGTLAQQQGIQISKAADGEIIYTVNNSSQTSVGSNTISTPNGGQYQVRLPDGTKVWLNAASTLTYATDLSISKTRVVQLGGEAYFEVAHDRARPFIVKTTAQEVEVLGTHFNVNSYNDNGRTVTTLAEGSVRVSSLQGEQSVTLKPTEQAIQQSNGLSIQVADMRVALAWKDGNIIFRNATIEEIMQQVARWYNVTVVYEGKLKPRLFDGGISRSSKLSALLNILKDSNINFELKETAQGKTLVIKP